MYSDGEQEILQGKKVENEWYKDFSFLGRWERQQFSKDQRKQARQATMGSAKPGRDACFIATE